MARRACARRSRPEGFAAFIAPALPRRCRNLAHPARSVHAAARPADMRSFAGCDEPQANRIDRSLLPPQRGGRVPSRCAFPSSAQRGKVPEGRMGASRNRCGLRRQCAFETEHKKTRRSRLRTRTERPLPAAATFPRKRGKGSIPMRLCFLRAAGQGARRADGGESKPMRPPPPVRLRSPRDAVSRRRTASLALPLPPLAGEGRDGGQSKPTTHQLASALPKPDTQANSNVQRLAQAK